MYSYVYLAWEAWYEITQFQTTSVLTLGQEGVDMLYKLAP